MSSEPSNATSADPATIANQALRDAEWAESAGLAERAIASYRTVTKHYPGQYWQVHNNLANLLLGQARPDEAVKEARVAQRLAPVDPAVNANLGRALLQLDQPGDALPYLMQALRSQPGQHPLRNLASRALLDSGRRAEAIALWREVAGSAGDDFELLNLLAKFFQRVQLGPDAERCLLRMKELRPDHAPAYGDLAQLYVDCAEFGKGVEIAEAGLLIDPESLVFLNTLGNCLASMGFVPDAIAAYRKLLARAPDLAPVRSNVLLTLHYPSEVSPAEIVAEHLRFGEMHAPATYAQQAFGNRPDPGRRLRVGYMSPDFRRHSVAFFLEALLENHDRSAVELYAYATVHSPDDVTERLKRHFAVYRNVADTRVDRIAEIIRADEVDILVDLAGHAGNQYVQALAYKPAPVVVTYLGYPDTTGMAAVDYRLTDWRADPPGAEPACSETLVRLPRGFLCYRPPADAPDPGPAPVSQRGHITFGSFNREFKTSRKAWDLWCTILRAVPGSRMLLKSMAGKEPRTREFQLAQLASRGIDASRVDMLGFIPAPGGHMATYSQVDIALDTFPYNGTTTTLDSLYMGVPVVSLKGYNHASRVGSSILAQAGLGELLAHSADEYVAKAVALARDPARVTDLQAGLRARVLQSSLCDAAGLTRDLEAALRGMWCRWCRDQGAQLDAGETRLATLDFGPPPPDALLPGEPPVNPAFNPPDGR